MIGAASLTPTQEFPKAKRAYETIRREQNAISSRLLYLRLCREHFQLAPDRYKDRFLPSTIIGSPWEIAGIRVSRPEIPLANIQQERWLDALQYGNRGIRHIQAIVAKQFGLTIGDLISPCRARRFCHPRFIAYYLARRHTACSLPEIGRRFGGRDHSSIHNGLRKIEKLMATDVQFAGLVAHLSGKLA